jgi:anti-sigma28 factor (negative regulator of flagellin synthesis)
MKIGDRILLRTPRPAGERTPERRLAAARLLATLSQARDWAPDPLRARRIQSLKKAVESGTYRIDYQRTAQAMLGEIVGEALA